MAKRDTNESMAETDQGRRARYLISAAVLFLILLVGAIFVTIVLVRGNEADTGEQGAPSVGHQATGLVGSVASGPAR